MFGNPPILPMTVPSTTTIKVEYDSDVERKVAGVDKEGCRMFYVKFVVYFGGFLGFSLFLIGASGVSADLELSGRILSTGIVQFLLALPGIVGLKMKKRRLWHFYGFLNFWIGICEFGWMIVAIKQNLIFSSVILGLCFFFQMAAFVATILYLKIKGIKSFLNEIKNLKNDETSSTFTQKTLTGNILPTTTSTTKEKEQATPEYKTPPKKQASTTDAKTITEKTDDATQKNVKQPSIETRFEKANESLKMLVDNSKKIQDDAKSKKSDTHLLPEDHEKIVEMLKKPAKIHKNSESQRTPRFYFKETDTGTLSESPPSERERREKRAKKKLLRRMKRAEEFATRLSRELIKQQNCDLPPIASKSQSNVSTIPKEGTPETQGKLEKSAPVSPITKPSITVQEKESSTQNSEGKSPSKT